LAPDEARFTLGVRTDAGVRRVGQALEYR